MVVAWLAAAGFEGALVSVVGAGVSVWAGAWAIGASTTSATFSASALALVRASKHEIVASQWPRFTSLAVWETWQQ